MSSKVDEDFILKIADLHHNYIMNIIKRDSKFENDEEYLLACLNNELEEDNNYIEMEKELESLNQDEWLEFLAIFYLGKGYYSEYDEAIEDVKSLGKHHIRQVIGKQQLSEYLRKANKLR